MGTRNIIAIEVIWFTGPGVLSCMQCHGVSIQVARFLGKMQNVEDEQARRVSFTLPIAKPKEQIVTKLALNSFLPGQVTCVKLAMGKRVTNRPLPVVLGYGGFVAKHNQVWIWAIFSKAKRNGVHIRI